jgi:hypothetical protein
MMVWWAATAGAATWLLEEDLRVEVRPPLVGWQDGRTRLRWLVEWEPAAPTFTAHLCSVEVVPMLGAETSWPAATVAAMPTLSRPVTWVDGQFQAGPVVETVGQGDDDGDGNPGITVEVRHPKVGVGQVFVRQTSRMSWAGRLGADGVVRGTMEYEPEQEMLGATTWWLRMGLSQRKHPRETSTFTLSPLPAGAPCGSAAS